MEAQLDVLAGKQKTLERYRDGLARIRDGRSATLPGRPTRRRRGAARGADPARRGVGAAPAVGRVVLAAQEDLRRDIARAMHDGPAQSLTNIVLQAQIVGAPPGSRPGGRAGRGRAS